jgi:hypothetical protein
MASTRRKLRKLRESPRLFVADLILKRLGRPAEKLSTGTHSFRFSNADFDVVDDYVLITNAKIVSELRRIKQVGSVSELQITEQR